MLFFNRSLTIVCYLVAACMAIVVPMGAGYIAFRLDPAACYDSPCALPLLLMTAPLFAAPALAVFFAVNRRFQRPVPDGWVPTVLMSCCFGQVAISVLSILLASPNIRRIFFSDILFIPQGFVVGLGVGAVFWAALYACGKEIAEP